MYKLVERQRTDPETGELVTVKTGVIHLPSTAFIPWESAIGLWQVYEDWAAKGNTPEPADPEPEPLPDPSDDLNIRLIALKGRDPLMDQLIDVMTGVGGKGRVVARPVEAP